MPGDEGTSVDKKLKNYLTQRQTEALNADPVGHKRLTAKYMMFGNGSPTCGRLVSKIMSTHLHKPTSVLFFEDGDSSQDEETASQSVLDMIWSM